MLRRALNAHVWATWLTLLGIGAATTLYALISLGNHDRFRTYAMDLGIKNQALWFYEQGLYSTSTLVSELETQHGQMHMLANHFEPILILIAPFYPLLGNTTLLWFQVLCIGLGGWGMFLLARSYLPNPLQATAVTWYFLFAWPVFSAIGFDFHTNVPGAMALPFLWYFLKMRRWIPLSLSIVFMLSCKETMAFWIFFIGIGMAWHFRSSPDRRNVALGTAGLGIASFFLIMNLAMPQLGGKYIGYFHFQYALLGDNIPEALKTVITRPLFAIQLLWENPEGTPNYVVEYKRMFFTACYMAGGFLVLLYPSLAIMAFPIVAQKMWNDQPARWSPFYQYSIELVPLFSMAIVLAASRWKSAIPGFVIVFVALFFGIRTSRDSLSWFRGWDGGRAAIDFTGDAHYTREFDTDSLHNLLKTIPSDVAVSATDFVVPHLAGRRKIYELPKVKDAEWVVLVDDGRRYARHLEAIEISDRLATDPNWEVAYNSWPFLILRRIGD
jgi:uncharacterized membrane protein